MPTPAQAAAATVGAGSLAAAGAYGITQAVNGSGEEETTTTEEQESTDDNKIPTEVSVFADTDVSAQPYLGKLISFIKQANLSSLVKPSDEKWWDWAFTNKFEKLKVGKQAHTVFASVTNSETLKTACDSAYKLEKTEYKFESNHHLLQNISDYCTKTANSIDVSEPKVTTFAGDQATNYANKLPSVEANKPKLVKPDEANNDIWWNWAFKNLYGKKTGTQSTTFATVNKGHSATESEKPLNKVCDEAYKKDYWDLKQNSWKLLGEIKQFCSVDSGEAALVPADPAAPTFLANADSYNGSQNTFAKHNNNYSKLVDPDQATNKNWWEWVFDKQYPKEQGEINKLDDPFTGVQTGYSDNHSPKSLKKACKDSYSKVAANFSPTKAGKTSLLDLIKQFCSTSEQQSSLQAPS